MVAPFCASGAAASPAGRGTLGWLLSLFLGFPAVLAASFASAPFLTSVIAAPLLVVLLSAYPLLVALTPVRRETFASERSFTSIDPQTGEQYTGTLPDLLHDAGRAAHEAFAAAECNTETKTDANANAEVELSVVVPAFNETARIQGMLEDALAYLDPCPSLPSNAEEPAASNCPTAPPPYPHHHPSPSPPLAAGAPPTPPAPIRSYEIIIVDDGSTDSTAAAVLRYVREKRSARGVVRVIRLERNRGKGGAVRHGVLHARGALILFADADGATRFADLGLLCGEMARIRTPSGHGIVVGSRAHLVGSEAVVKRSFVRNFLMHSFHLFLSLLLRPPSPHQLLHYLPFFSSPSPSSSLRPHPSISALSSLPASPSTAAAPTTRRIRLPAQPEIRDTQCGFKLFTRATARVVFPLAHIERWIFDVELLLLAEMASTATLRGDVLCTEGSVRAERLRLRKVGQQQDGENADVDENDVLLDLPVPIAEVPVHWEEVGGSKINLLKDSVGMALDLIVIRANYALGRWKSPGPVRIRAE
ncbi:glycosyltransferase family 2 protein [Tilletiaria anomala UBC 951]|uniref:dolichyl-phosphate beta-glucosyltransferase n=1 Tax=Tilletiaria anomala (strain ATCC 24038 / CBS 436.72 / UBC 951) TaxID=1037660 RepID=A0A066WPT8_TILAU|nr:glycosyltransferase family 2 protein [Tilletiaria anomala UBC 951]KDN52645.1 glycosyltransferase family 2 protein [Tilletiaria anomala UBC 951]